MCSAPCHVFSSPHSRSCLEASGGDWGSSGNTDAEASGAAVEHLKVKDSRSCDIAVAVVMLTLPVLDIIAQYCGCPWSIYNLCLVSARVLGQRSEIVNTDHWNEMLRTSTRWKQKTVLTKLNLHKIMFDNSILLSGSTMLQVAWNHIWHNADVDIFVTSEALSRASLMLTEAGYKEIHSMESIYADVPDPQENVPPLRPCPIRLVVRWSRTITDSVHQFKQTEQNIDVVVAWRHAPNAFVLLENFDILALRGFVEGV